MTGELLFHPKTKGQIALLLDHPPHGLLISGPSGSGKQSSAIYIASELLGVASSALANHAYFLLADPEGDNISIEEIRSMQQFLKLKVPGKSKGINRVILINQASRMRTEAQNALLKTLEEPPADTVMILTADNPESLLPTVVSRLSQLAILPITQDQAMGLYSVLGKKSSDIQKSYALSGGYAGMLDALMHEQDHPLLEYVELAKEILREPVGKRLLRSDQLAKEKSNMKLLFDALQRIAHAALITSGKQNKLSSVKQWHARLEIIQDTIDSLRYNPNNKLLLDNLFSNI